MATTKPIPEGWEPVARPGMFNAPEQVVKPIPEGWEEVAQPTVTTDRLGEAALGAGQGFISSTPAVAGAVAGLKLGLPFGPIPAVGGMIAGGVGGYYAGQSAEEAYKGFFPEPTDPTEKAFREGGKTFGSSLGFTAVAPYLPTMTGNRVGQFLTSIRDAAVRNPKSFKTAEVLGALGSGVGGGVAESMDPGAPVSRLVGEVSGGLGLGLTRTLVSQSGPMADGLKRLAGSVSASATESRAASRLSQILEDFGEDIPTLIRRLEADMPIDKLAVPGEKRLTPSAAQKTDSLGLTALESALGQTNKKFLADVREQGKQSAQAYQLLTERLKSIGTPEALVMSAQLQKSRFDSMIDGRLADADRLAALRISKITGDTPQARRTIGETIKEQTELALRDARDYESSLWKDALSQMTRKPVDMPPGVPLNVFTIPTLAPKNTVKDFLDYTTGIGDAVLDKNTPAVVKSIMSKFGVTPEAIKKYKAGRRSEEFALTGEIPARFLPQAKELDLSELVNYRSNLLSMAREAAGSGEAGNANFYSTIAQSLIKDLDTVKNPAFDEARTFSKSLNDVFTRTFAKTASESADVTRTGAERLPAEILVKRAFGANADVTAMRMNELEDAVKFMSNQYDSAVQRFGANSPQAAALKPSADVSRAGAASMADAQQRVLRMGAAAAIDSTFDPATGREITRLNTAKLKKFVAENKPMLDKLGITPDLTDAVKAENAFRMVQNENSALMKRAGDQYAFGQVLKVGNERPSIAIGSMLSGNNPVRDMKNLVKMATDSDNAEAAIRGLKSSLYDYAYTKATGPSGNFSPQAFEDAFFKPLGPNQPSVANVMRANGVMTLSEMKNLKRLTDPMARIEKAMSSGRLLDDIVPGSNAVEELVQRVIGAKIGTAAAPGGPGSLIAASAGSKAVRSIFDKMPNLSTVAVMEKAAQDPAFMALLLKRANTEQEKILLGRQLHSYLLSSGLNYATYEEPTPGPAPASQGQAAQQLRQMTPAPSTRGTGLNLTPKPPSPAGATGGAAGGATGAAPASPNARSMMQSLFPFDSVSGLASQQQQQPAPR